MRILFLSYYFEPDLSAGSFRATALLQALLSQVSGEVEIDVVTTQPNRYHTYSDATDSTERRGNATIHRVKLPAHKNGFLDQALTFRHYASFVQRIAKGKQYDLVFGTSSRLMTAVLAARMSRKLGARLYLDIRDIFVDTISDVFPRHITSWAVPVFTQLERYAVKKADHINLVSAGFQNYFSSRYPAVSLSFFTNGIDDLFTRFPWSASANQGSVTRVLYAGNFGDGQGLHLIVPELAQKMGDSFQFRLIGDGSKKAALQQKVEELGLSNVTVVPPVKRDSLLEEYQNADILFLHLNDVPAFEKVLPSKLFEYGATGKPIFAGVAGFAGKFVEEELSNSAVFKPCDVDAAVIALKSLSRTTSERADFIKKYSRDEISATLAADVIRVAAAQRN